MEKNSTIINEGIWGWFPENVNTSNWFGFVLFSGFHVVLTSCIENHFVCAFLVENSM